MIPNIIELAWLVALFIEPAVNGAASQKWVDLEVEGIWSYPGFATFSKRSVRIFILPPAIFRVQG